MRFFDGSDTVRRARESFDGAGYTFEGLSERLGRHAYAHLAGGEVAPLLRATRSGDRLDTLLRLFVVGAAVPLDAARAALAPLAVEAWAKGGAVDVDGDDVRARIAIRPLGGPEPWLVVHDLPPVRGDPVPADHVLGVSASTRALAGSTIRRPIGAALDLGTGCGVQALYASTHSERVIGSDLNPRAIACATLTLELNGVANVALREGDRFEPVEDETFDLVVANPPFVISPARRYLFRDSDLPVDELSRSIVRAAPGHLVEGGHCQLLASWAHVRGEDWRERLAGWVAGTGCDAVVLEREVLDPSAHAASWLRHTEPPDRWQAEYDDWMADHEAHRIEAVGFGLITMRKRAGGTPSFRAEEATQEFAVPCGDNLGAAFELADLLAAHPGALLLEVPLRVAPDVVLDERARPTSDGWSPTDRRLRQTDGLRWEGEVDAAVAAIVAACDGSRPLGAVLHEAAAAAETDPARLARGALPVVRRLVELGFLLPVVD